MLQIPAVESQVGGEPLREGPDVWPKEAIEGVAETVVRAEPPLRRRHQAKARPQRVHDVRAGTRHCISGPGTTLNYLPKLCWLQLAGYLNVSYYGWDTLLALCLGNLFVEKKFWNELGQRYTMNV